MGALNHPRRHQHRRQQEEVSVPRPFVDGSDHGVGLAAVVGLVVEEMHHEEMALQEWRFMLNARPAAQAQGSTCPPSRQVLLRKPESEPR